MKPVPATGTSDAPSGTSVAPEGFFRARAASHFGTKAGTLAALKGRLASWRIPDFEAFGVAEWRTGRESVLRSLAKRLPDAALIVRSSAGDEDGAEFALAGRYSSVAGVRLSDRAAFEAAVDQVIASYGRDGRPASPDDEVLVQVMVAGVAMSGVLLTQEMNTGAPYYVINYDDESGATDSVTSGGAYSNRTLLVHRGSEVALRSPRFRALIDGVAELEAVTGSQSLDVEFAVDEDNRLYLLQVRPITTEPNWNRGIALRLNDALARVRSFVADRSRPMDGCFGSRSVFGQMPDWNPAEMIGRTPRPLALSLYRTLITDRAWREARQRMGYAVPEGMPLMVSLAGQPYVDVRLSFHSYLPADLSPVIGRKLVDAWLDRLVANPWLHDKVEFDVAVTALTFDFEERARRQIGDALDERETGELRDSLTRLTRDLVTGRRSSVADALAAVERLAVQRNRLIESGASALVAVSSLLENCVEHGTVPFSILARHAFVANSLLRSLQVRGVLGAEDLEAIASSVKTVATDLVEDMARVAAGAMAVDAFMSRYGHLRPGTYDIRSLRYDQRNDLFGRRVDGPAPTRPNWSPSAAQRRGIEAALAEAGAEVSVDGFFEYVRAAIQGREYGKFVFTRNLSDALELIAGWGEGIGLSRDELSYLGIRDILDALSVAEGRTMESHLRALLERGREAHAVTTTLHLPQLIVEADDVVIVPLMVDQPNFVTSKTADGRAVILSGTGAAGHAELRGAIVLIESADPGFDWVFAHGIAGLVTKYGGSNSHMAIRCAEFGVPAAIGCGEQIYDRLQRASAIEINCGEKRVTPQDR